MTLQYSVPVQNARLDAVESTTGPGAILQFFTGSAPASCAAADTGTVVATFPLPADYMANAANGSKSKIGTWEDISADADGVLGYFRFKSSDGATCHVQGTISQTGGGGDMTVDNTNVKAGQDIVVNTFTLTSGNR